MSSCSVELSALDVMAGQVGERMRMRTRTRAMSTRRTTSGCRRSMRRTTSWCHMSLGTQELVPQRRAHPNDYEKLQIVSTIVPILTRALIARQNLNV